MNNFLTSIMESNGYNLIENSSLKIFGNKYEFFLLEHFEIGELKNVFKSEKLDSLILEFQKFTDEKIKKNTSLFILVKVSNLQEVYEQYLNTTIVIEEDEYYFRKYVIFYTEDGLNRLQSNEEDLLNYIQSENFSGESLFDEFERNIFFEDAYFIAMQLIIKLPFISLPHSSNQFERIEDRIESQIEIGGLFSQETQVNRILEILDSNNLSDKLEDSGVLERLNQILED